VWYAATEEKQRQGQREWFSPSLSRSLSLSRRKPEIQSRRLCKAERNSRGGGEVKDSQRAREQELEREKEQATERKSKREKKRASVHACARALPVQAKEDEWGRGAKET